MSLLDDWVEFCEGKRDFDKSHFLPLFHGSLNDDDLREIYQFFPQADLLSERMKRFQAAKKARKERSIVPVSSSQIMDLAAADMSAKSSILAELGEEELARFAGENKPSLTTDRNAFDYVACSDWPNGEKHVVVGDYVDEQMLLPNKQGFALFEALYGAANSYDIQYFLAAPLIKSDVDFVPYFELWSAGSDVALAEDSILVFTDETLFSQS
ncbi:hypothetical protein [Cognatiyoonia sp. IB215182]|uniref:hypothetical protein n=1 Tax=Cognatiyoonia sp. IB215182 TaxID=3097353 RepID=UPI002A1455DE|nr:hypothetical protein [Cognatiyoonia sp. IB215182]MDX8355186.1 hypothetical protein [Cognatiyoonia sp. IB215182]